MHNVLIQHQRAAHRLRRAGQTVPLADSGELAPPSPLPGPSQLLRGEQAYRSLLAAVFDLPSGQQEAIRRYLRGTPVADIARDLGKSPAAVSCLLQRGGHTLQEKLGGHGALGPWFQAMRDLLAAAP